MDFREIKYFNSLPYLSRNSNLGMDVSDVVRINVKGTVDFDEISETLEARDYCILKFISTISIREFAQKASAYFGELIPQTQDSDSFMYSVEYNPQKQLSNLQLNSNRAQPMHTDGQFKEKSPKYLCLYCHNRSKSGGFSQIVFADDVYNYINSLSSEVTNQLFNEYIEYFRRKPSGGLFIYRKRLFFTRNDGKIGISYNPIMYKIEASKEVEQALILINYFTNRSSNQTIFKLEDNEMLIADNERLLHGRTHFDKSSSRKLERLWFSGKNIE